MPLLGSTASFENKGEGEIIAAHAGDAHLVVEVDGFNGEDAGAVGSDECVVEERRLHDGRVEEGAGVGEAAAARES